MDFRKTQNESLQLKETSVLCAQIKSLQDKFAERNSAYTANTNDDFENWDHATSVRSKDILSKTVIYILACPTELLFGSEIQGFYRRNVLTTTFTPI